MHGRVAVLLVTTTLFVGVAVASGFDETRSFASVLPDARATNAVARAPGGRARSLRSRSALGGTSPQSFTNAWTPLGPAPIKDGFYAGPNSGRVASLAVSSSGTIFAGTASGGVWSSTNGGTSWVTHTDSALTGLAIGAVAVDPSNPLVVYAGTGEDNNCGDCFSGAGVLKSIDGGNTWTVLNAGGVFTGASFASLVVDPHNDQELYAGTDSGFFESADGGATWAPPAGHYDPGFGFADGVVIDPTTFPTTVYVATEDAGIEKSTDGGANFVTLAGGLPAGRQFGVTALAIGTSSTNHPNADQDLYAAIQLDQSLDPNRGQLSMYKSTNAGATWTHVTAPPYTTGWAYDGRVLPATGDPGDQASYDNTLAVDPANPAHVLAGGIALIETTNGGKTWTNANGKTFFAQGTNRLHPDFHAITFNGAGLAIIGCDGGIYTKRGSTVANLNTDLDTAQFFEGMSVYRDGAIILGGTQDNGTALSHKGKSWTAVLDGDGGYTAINALQPTQQFGEADKFLFRTASGWQQDDATDITPPGAESDGNVDTSSIPPIALAPNPAATASPTLYYGAGDLWVTHNPAAKRPTWVRLAHVGASVSAIAVAPSNNADVYVGFTNGTILASKNATSPDPTFTNIRPPSRRWVTHISVDATNPTSIAVTFSSYNTPPSPTPPKVVTGAIDLSGTPTATWTNISGDLPGGVGSTSVVYDRGALVVATEVGVFDTTAPNGTKTVWEPVGTGLPNVQVIGLVVDTAGNLYAATHGRGAWELRT